MVESDMLQNMMNVCGMASTHQSDADGDSWWVPLDADRGLKVTLRNEGSLVRFSTVNNCHDVRFQIQLCLDADTELTEEPFFELFDKTVEALVSPDEASTASDDNHDDQCVVSLLECTDEFASAPVRC